MLACPSCGVGTAAKGEYCDRCGIPRWISDHGSLYNQSIRLVIVTIVLVGGLSVIGYVFGRFFGE